MLVQFIYHNWPIVVDLGYRRVMFAIVKKKKKSPPNAFLYLDLAFLYMLLRADSPSRAILIEELASFSRPQCRILWWSDHNFAHERGGSKRYLYDQSLISKSYQPH